MRSRLVFGALAVVAALVTGCIGALSPGPSPSLPLSPSSAVATSTPVASGSPNPTKTPSLTTATACAAPVTVAVLGGGSPAWPIDHLADCFGHRDLALTGYLAPPWGIGGLTNGIAPAWLGEWEGLPAVLWLKPHPADGCFAADDCLWIFLHAPDAAALQLTPDRWVALTGHLDDPAASTCRATGHGPDAATSDAQAVVQCREHFVVTEILTVAAPMP